MDEDKKKNGSCNPLEIRNRRRKGGRKGGERESSPVGIRRGEKGEGKKMNQGRTASVSHLALGKSSEEGGEKEKNDHLRRFGTAGGESRDRDYSFARRETVGRGKRGEKVKNSMILRQRARGTGSKKRGSLRLCWTLRWRGIQKREKKGEALSRSEESPEGKRGESPRSEGRTWATSSYDLNS